MSIEDQLDLVGPRGSMKRLIAIASMNLGDRTAAAQRVILKREARKHFSPIWYCPDCGDPVLITSYHCRCGHK